MESQYILIVFRTSYSATYAIVSALHEQEKGVVA